MPQLERLVIDSASPISPHFLNNPIYDAELPSLSHLDISGSVFDCGLALSHLILPALTSLRVTTRSDHLTAYEVKEISPYIWEHAHGYQDTEPLQSVFIHNERTCLDIVAWNTPSIDVTAWDSNRSARVALSFTTSDESDLDNYGEILEMAIGALPLYNLVMLTSPCKTRLDESFWRIKAWSWPRLERVDLAPRSARGFLEILLQDDGGRGRPLLPSLTYLRLGENSFFSGRRFFCLRDTLMKRVEQGVPLEVLDLRTCFALSPVVVRRLSEIVVNVWGPPEPESDTDERMGDDIGIMWDGVHLPFICDDAI